MIGSRLICIGLLGFVLMGSTDAEGQDDARAADEIAALVARYDSNWNSRDTVALGRLLAPQYQYFTSRGGMWTRADLLRLVGSPEYGRSR